MPEGCLKHDVIELWDAARRAASPWLQVDDVEYSRQVVRRHGIDGCWPLPIEALDLWAREFIHQQSGESIIVYSLQRWQGTPRLLPEGAIRVG